LKGCRTLHQHRLACLSNTRKQVLRSRTQFDRIWQPMWPKLGQHSYGRPAWKQNGRASAYKKIADGCEEIRIYLTKTRLRAGLYGR
jgi:hypothetical protein